MNWYRLDPYHIEFYPRPLKYYSTPEGILRIKRLNEFYYSYIRPFYGRTGPEPIINPVEDSIFLLGMHISDLYCTLGRLSRHLICSDKLTQLLIDHKLSGYKLFNQFTLQSKEISIDTYNYFHFYESMWDKVDIVFEFQSKSDPTDVGRIQFQNAEEYDAAQKQSAIDRKMIISPKEITIPGIRTYDCFPLLNLDEISYFFVSERLYKKMILAKLSFNTYEINHVVIKDDL